MSPDIDLFRVEISPQPELGIPDKMFRHFSTPQGVVAFLAGFTSLVPATVQVVPLRNQIG